MLVSEAVVVFGLVFFFKQKTAYEMRISDWSSDVCSSDLRIYNVAAKGRIAVGYDADLTVVDLKAKRAIKNDWIASRCGWTPYDGMTVTGWPQIGRASCRERVCKYV